MKVFHYDKTFEGLLSAVFDAYTLKMFPDALLALGDTAPLLTSGSHSVENEQLKAERVTVALCKKLSRHSLRDLLHAWLSEETEADMRIFRFICKTFNANRSIEHDLADRDAFAVVRLAKKVRGELHSLTGFTRFQKTADGVYFAAIAPRHNVLHLMLPHFTNRFADQRWILYDIKRRFGVYYDLQRHNDVLLGREEVKTLEQNQGKLDVTLLEEQEVLFQNLWKEYFSAISIQERKNLKQQSRCMPRRFWPLMTEKQ